MDDVERFTELPHYPVLYKEIIHLIRPKPGGRYVDGTIGAGGHAWGILEASSPDGLLLGLDVDPDALDHAKRRLSPFGSRVILVRDSYASLIKRVAELNWSKVEGILLDLGVSSMQLDAPDRGFSFRVDSPLDMRFDLRTPTRASDLVNNLSEAELADLIFRFGEERRARKIARWIIQARPVMTTGQLVDIIVRAIGAGSRSGRGRIHPATRTFQALRIAVNQELQVLEKCLPDALFLLSPGSRLAVISFHSLEDRIVKRFFRRESQDCICPPGHIQCTCDHQAMLEEITRRPIRPSADEMKNNPRARSARLRVAEKIE